MVCSFAEKLPFTDSRQQKHLQHFVLRINFSKFAGNKSEIYVYMNYEIFGTIFFQDLREHLFMASGPIMQWMSSYLKLNLVKILKGEKL